jgi:hypothetical protein
MGVLIRWEALTGGEVVEGCFMNMRERVFYHIYPLGFCGCREQNDFACPAGDGVRALETHIPRLVELGVNAVYLGPLFESTALRYPRLFLC